MQASRREKKKIRRTRTSLKSKGTRSRRKTEKKRQKKSKKKKRSPKKQNPPKRIRGYKNGVRPGYSQSLQRALPGLAERFGKCKEAHYRGHQMCSGQQ